MNAQHPRPVRIKASEYQIVPHAQKRMQQRGISEELVVFLVAYGARTHTRGEYRHIFDGKRKNVVIPKQLQEKLRRRPCVITKDDKIITAKWQYAKIKTKPGRRKSRKRGMR